MYDPVASWKKSPSLDVKNYVLDWTRNGQPAGSGVVARFTGAVGPGDVNGYTAKFSQHNPGVTVGDGDVISATLRAVDEGGLACDPLQPASGPLTVPAEPPAPPTDFTLKLV